MTQKSSPWFGYCGLGIYHDHLGVRATPATGYIRISNGCGRLRHSFSPDRSRLVSRGGQGAQRAWEGVNFETELESGPQDLRGGDRHSWLFTRVAEGENMAG